MNTHKFYPILKKMGFLLLFACLFNPLHGQAQKQYDIIINEFMPDPSPQVGLPNAEYIELYNRNLISTFNLKNFKLISGSDTTILDSFQLKPKQYLTIYTKKSGISFSKFGDTLLVKKLIALNNPGDTIRLEDDKKTVLDAVYYDISFSIDVLD